MINMISPELLVPGDLDQRYANSPFVYLKSLLPKPRGSRYEKITIEVMKKIGYDYKPRTSSDNDAIFNDVKYEIKGSMLNINSDNFSFLQIRPDQDYDAVLFAMFYPQELVLMQMSKQKVNENIANNIFKKQHGGNKGQSKTYMYYGNKETLLKVGATLINEV